VKQDLDSMLFARLGVQTHFENGDVETLNLGYRKKHGADWIFGGYVGLDRSKTDLGNDYTQFALGLEP
jgi:hypothetical protein